MALTTYGDISPRTAAYAVANMLKRALPYLVIEKFGQSFPIPNNSTKTAKFRRYEALPRATTPLVEGVTPAGKSLTYTDVTANLQQYGDFVPLTDVIADTHEDPVFMEAQDIIAEQAAQTVEAIRYGIIKAGTNFYYANKVAQRNLVIAAPAKEDLRRIVRGLKRQNAGFISKMTSASPNYKTEAVRPCFVGLTHVDLEGDYRSITTFIDAKDYAVQGSALSEFEFGTCEGIRLIQSTVFEPFADAGGAKGSMVSTGGTSADVYPTLVIAKDAYGLVPLKGKDSISPIVLNPNNPSDSDPLGQRGYVGWKLMTTAVILNELFMARLESTALDL